MSKAMSISPFKINLGLHILSKLPNGYHTIESCMYPIQYGDTITLCESSEFQLVETGLLSNCAVEDNLVTKAYRLLQTEFQLPNIQLELHKQLPHGAGIGGGSANAAVCLKLLNSYFQLGLTHSALEVYAAKIGADCPFFIKTKPRIATGIGTSFLDVEVPNLSPFFLGIIHPSFGVSTKQAYADVFPNADRPPLSTLLAEPIQNWKTYLKNDFEESVFIEFPILEEYKLQMYELGAIYASMSGSGSAIYGIFSEIPSNFYSSFSELEFVWIGKM